MAITSSTDVCNLASDLLSAGTLVDIENPTTANEETFSRWYDLTRRRALRSHPWNFAIRRAILAASSTDPVFGYEKAFPVPSNFLRILYLSTDQTVNDEAVLPTKYYQVEGGKILISNQFTNTDALHLVYVADVKDVSSFDPMFIDLLAHDIALSVSYKLTETNTNVQRIAEIAKQRAALAKSIDGQERPPQRVEYSRALNARRGGSSRNNHRVIF